MAALCIGAASIVFNASDAVAVSLQPGKVSALPVTSTLPATLPETLPKTLPKIQPTATLPTSAASVNSAPVDARDDYLNYIESLESDFGPYATQLSEHLFDMGLSQQRSGDHKSAMDTLYRAMHISRINGGLYNLDQVPIIEKLIDSQVARGEWEDANNSHQYLYWLHRRNFDENDPRMLPALEKMSRWHLQAYTVNINRHMLDHLISAYTLFNAAISLIEKSPQDLYQANQARLVNALRGITLSNYYLATLQQSNLDDPMVRNQLTPDERMRLEQYIMNSYRSGKNAIERIQDVYASNPASPPAGAFEAQVEMADWHMLFNRPDTAIGMYRQTHAALQQNPQLASKSRELFSQPVALPSMTLLNSQVGGSDEPASADAPYVLVKFDVTASGRAINIQVVDSLPANNVRNRNHVRRSLKTAIFRPRFENGMPVATQAMVHRFVFAPAN